MKETKHKLFQSQVGKCNLDPSFCYKQLQSFRVHCLFTGQFNTEDFMAPNTAFDILFSLAPICPTRQIQYFDAHWLVYYGIKYQDNGARQDNGWIL